MKVLVLSHSAVLPAYRQKFHLLAKMGTEVHLVLPPGWPEGQVWQTAPSSGPEQGIMLHRLPARWLGRPGAYHLLGLNALVGSVRPDLIYAEEEPYAWSAWQASRLARKKQLPFCFFTWENIHRSYRWPQNWAYVEILKAAVCAIAGSDSAATVLRQKGFPGPVTVIPQYGVDTDLFRPAEARAGARVWTLGYFGRMVPEKGLDTLLAAVKQVPGPLRLRLQGAGPYRQALERRVQTLDLRAQVEWHEPVTTDAMPGSLAQCDAVVLPSESRPRWMEQFGRILIEAMACGLPVIGSDCGEIPRVIGPAGWIFPQGRPELLAAGLVRLRADRHWARTLGQRGRARAVERFSMRTVAAETNEVFQRMLKE